LARKVAIFAFNGELMCFAHAMLNALDMKKRGFDVKLILEGRATALIEELSSNPDKPFSNLYATVKKEGLVDCVCKQCSDNMGTLESAKTQGLPICEEMMGHPSVARYMEEGYEVLVF